MKCPRDEYAQCVASCNRRILKATGYTYIIKLECIAGFKSIWSNALMFVGAKVHRGIYHLSIFWSLCTAYRKIYLQFRLIVCTFTEPVDVQPGTYSFSLIVIIVNNVLSQLTTNLLMGFHKLCSW